MLAPGGRESFAQLNTRSTMSIQITAKKAGLGLVYPVWIHYTAGVFLSVLSLIRSEGLKVLSSWISWIQTRDLVAFGDRKQWKQQMPAKLA
ncbi:hypothetical protein BaRGS_00006302 [Batillaria attramentaria]|uniref:Uncharacterized protein n=1 Tax=Batillaria attramentaria TaxID=370345 RepID=A0ABD0LS25_9CAEN